MPTLCRKGGSRTGPEASPPCRETRLRFSCARLTRAARSELAELARDLVFRGGVDAAASLEAWRSLIGDESAVARELRQGLLQGMSLVRPTGEQIELLVFAS